MQNEYRSLFPIALAMLVFPFATLLTAMGLYWFYERISDYTNLAMPALLNIILGILGAVGSFAMTVCVPIGLILLVIAIVRWGMSGTPPRSSVLR